MTDCRLIPSRSELVREVRRYIRAFTEGGSRQALIVADENTRHLLPELPADLVVAPGEACKTVSVAHHLWQELVRRHFSKKDLLIGIGGGSVTDLCGFVAATYKRGCHVAYIPTTLTGLIDASLGGKCGVNLTLDDEDGQTVKNLIGTIYQPSAVFGCTELVQTPDALFAEGMGELIKYYCLFDPYPVATLEAQPDLTEMIRRCIDYKLAVVAEDPYDTDLRQNLNLGHTVAHALEGYALAKGYPILHGIAVAAGLVIEGYFSFALIGLTQTKLLQLATYIRERLPVVHYDCGDYDTLWTLALQDKKNGPGTTTVTCTLLRDFGDPIRGCQVDRKLWDEALDFYKDLMRT